MILAMVSRSVIVELEGLHDALGEEWAGRGGAGSYAAIHTHRRGETKPKGRGIGVELTFQ